MKFHTEYLTFNTKNHREYVNMTADVEKAVTTSGITDGMVLVSAMHITASVYVNDAESGLIADMMIGWSTSRPSNETTAITAQGRPTATRT